MSVVLLILDTVDFKTRIVARDREGCCIRMKVSIQQEAVLLVSIYVPNLRAPKCIKQILTGIKGEKDSNTVKVGDFNTALNIHG